MYPDPDQSEDAGRSIRRAPLSGDVVNAGGCGPGPEGFRRLTRGECCGKDLGPMDDQEEPSPEDLERFSGVTRDCPNCGKEISDDADMCYFCGEPVSGSSRALPTWTIVAGLLVIVGLVVAFVFRGSIF